MRAAVIDEFNQPWTIKQVKDPRPSPGQVLGRVRASGICGTDVHVHHGPFPLKPPIIAGHEPAGEVGETGPGVTNLRPGDRVGTSGTRKDATAARDASPAGPQAARRTRRGWTSAAATRS